MDLPSLISDESVSIGGFAVAPVGFGCWRFVHGSVADARAVLDAAIEAGIDLIDTADVYGADFGGPGFGAAEEMLGRCFAEDPDLRDSVVLATKVGISPDGPGYDTSAAWIRRACEDSLRRLGVESIDLYQLHRHDPLARPADVAAALVELRDEGLVGEVGVSNHTVEQHQALQAHLPFEIASTQPPVSVAHRAVLHDGTANLAACNGVALLAYSPLAEGRVATGEGLPPELLSVLDELAGREGVERTTVAIAWVLALAAPTVALIGTQNPARVVEAARASSVHLDRADWYRVLEAAQGEPMP